MVIQHDSIMMDTYYELRLAKHSFAFDDELKVLSRQLRFTYLSKRDLFCRGESVSDCPLMCSGKLFTYDRHHLSLSAAREMGAKLKARHSHLFILKTERQ